MNGQSIKHILLHAKKLNFNKDDDYRINLIKAFILYAKAQGSESVNIEDLLYIINIGEL